MGWRNICGDILIAESHIVHNWDVISPPCAFTPSIITLHIAITVKPGLSSLHDRTRNPRSNTNQQTQFDLICPISWAATPSLSHLPFTEALLGHVRSLGAVSNAIAEFWWAVPLGGGYLLGEICRSICLPESIASSSPYPLRGPLYT
jgi:hypothetical protein